MPQMCKEETAQLFLLRAMGPMQQLTDVPLQLVIMKGTPPYSGFLLPLYVQGIHAYRSTTQCNASTVIKQKTKLPLPLRFAALGQEPATAK